VVSCTWPTCMLAKACRKELPWPSSGAGAWCSSASVSSSADSARGLADTWAPPLLIRNVYARSGSHSTDTAPAQSMSLQSQESFMLTGCTCLQQQP
jgi:hypothetical protein